MCWWSVPRLACVAFIGTFALLALGVESGAQEKAGKDQQEKKVVPAAAPAPEKEKDGVVSDGKGNRIIPERHGYALVPGNGGFYVLNYPATRDGFEKFQLRLEISQ